METSNMNCGLIQSYIAMYILVLLLGQVYLSRINTTTCKDKNPFLQALKGRNVTIYDAPYNISDSYGDEWKKFGSCCEVNSIKKYALLDKANIQAAANRSVNILKNYYRFWKVIFNGCEANDENILVSVLKDICGTIKKQFRKNIVFENFKKEVRQSKRQDIISEDFNKCWLHMAMIRSNSLCSTCSGRSDSFFSKGKALVTEQTCHSIIENCRSSFEVLTLFIRGFSHILEKMREVLVGLEFFIKHTDQMNKLMLEFNQNKMYNLVTKLHMSKPETPDRNRNEKLVCEQMVKMSGSTFIGEIDRMLSSDRDLSYLLLSIFEHSFKMSSKQVNQTSQQTHQNQNGRLLTSNWDVQDSTKTSTQTTISSSQTSFTYPIIETMEDKKEVVFNGDITVVIKDVTHNDLCISVTSSIGDNLKLIPFDLRLNFP